MERAGSCARARALTQRNRDPISTEYEGRTLEAVPAMAEILVGILARATLQL